MANDGTDEAVRPAAATAADVVLDPLLLENDFASVAVLPETKADNGAAELGSRVLLPREPYAELVAGRGFTLFSEEDDFCEEKLLSDRGDDCSSSILLAKLWSLRAFERDGSSRRLFDDADGAVDCSLANGTRCCSSKSPSSTSIGSSSSFWSSTSISRS